MERRAVLGLGRREAVQRPVARPHGVLHVGHRQRHVHAVGDAGRVGDDEARSGPRLGLDQRLCGLSVVGADRDLGDVDVAVRPGDRSEVLLPAALARGGELGDGATRCRLRGLAARVGVHLGVEHEDVDVPAARQDVVEASEADVIGPSVTADDPCALADERIGDGGEVEGRHAVLVAGVEIAEDVQQRRHTLALGSDPRLSGLVGGQDVRGQMLADERGQSLDELPRLQVLRLVAEAQPEPELGVVLEQRVVPGGTPSLGVGGPRGGWQIAAVDRRASSGVGDDHAIAEQLCDEFDVRRLAASGARAGELEQRL